MSCVKIDPALHQAKKPEWIKVRLPSNPVFFSTESAHFRSPACTRFARKPSARTALGMLEPGDGDFHDRWRPLHTRACGVLRGDDCEAICPRKPMSRSAWPRRYRA